jgi:hypothetical protein
MHIDLATATISHDEVEGPATLDSPKARRTKCLVQPPEIAMAHCEVKVIMWSTLFAQECVDTPAAADPHLDPTALQEPKDLAGILRGHFSRGSSNGSESPDHEWQFLKGRDNGNSDIGRLHGVHFAPRAAFQQDTVYPGFSGWDHIVIEPVSDIRNLLGRNSRRSY